MNKLVSVVSSISLASILTSCVVYETRYEKPRYTKGVVVSKDKVRTAMWPSNREYRTYINSELEGIIYHDSREIYRETEIGDTVDIALIGTYVVGLNGKKEVYKKQIEIKRDVDIIKKNK